MTRSWVFGTNVVPRLSSAKHICRIAAKCDARMGYLFSRLPLKSVPLSVALAVFNVYLLPIVSYGLPSWCPGTAASSKNKLAVIWTKFLKRYLGVPYAANNAIVYHVTGTGPFLNLIESLHVSMFQSTRFPPSMDGLAFPQPEASLLPVPVPPDYFYLCPNPLTQELPILPFPRRALAYDLMDLHHGHMCRRGFHPHSDEEEACVCCFCSRSMEPYHRFQCPIFYASSPSQVLREIMGIANVA